MPIADIHRFLALAISGTFIGGCTSTIQMPATATGYFGSTPLASVTADEVYPVSGQTETPLLPMTQGAFIEIQGSMLVTDLPSGQYLLRVGDTDTSKGGVVIYADNLETGKSWRIGSEIGGFVIGDPIAWSPAMPDVVVVADGDGLNAISLRTRASQRLQVPGTTCVDVSLAHHTAMGYAICASNDTGRFSIYQFDLESGVVEKTTFGGDHQVELHDIRWSMDDKLVAVLAASFFGGSNNEGLYILAPSCLSPGAECQDPSPLIPAGKLGYEAPLAWGPGGDQIAVTTDELNVITLSGDPIAAVEPPQRIQGNLAFSPRGDQIAVDDGGGHLYVWTVGSNSFEEVVSENSSLIDWVEVP